MFSLIITIISIALVAALALATLYYGGDAFNQGSARAEAARILNQGQQLMGAADLYIARTGQIPTLQKLQEDGYLKDIPRAALVVQSAQANGVAWTMPADGQHVVFTLTGVAEAVCQEVNADLHGVNGILTVARTALVSQCYGPGETYTVVFAKTGAVLRAAADLDNPGLPTATVSDAAVPDASDTAAWEVPPTTVVAGGGTGGGTGGGSGDPGRDPADPGPTTPPVDPGQYLDVRITSFAFANDTTTGQPIPDSGNRFYFTGPMAASGGYPNWTCTVTGNLPDPRLFQQDGYFYLSRTLGPAAYLPGGVGDQGDGTHISSYSTYLYEAGGYYENGGPAANMLSCTDGVVNLSTPDYRNLTFTPPAVGSGGQVCLRFDSNLNYAGPGTCS